MTHDQDFLRLQAAGADHAGILFAAQGARPLGELIRLLVLMWELVEPADMRRHVEFL